jgi:hypothetical protein
MAHFSMQTSAWILTWISIDRYLIVTNSIWKQKFSKNIKFNLGIIIFVILTIGLLNVPAALLNGEYTTVFLKFNETSNSFVAAISSQRKVVCYNSWFYVNIWKNFALVFECILPLFLMILFNSLLIHKTHQSSIKLNNSQSHLQREASSKILKSISMSSNLNKGSKKKRNASFASLILMNEKRPEQLMNYSKRVNSSSEGNYYMK